MGVYVTTAERGRARGLLLAGLLLTLFVVVLLALLPLAALVLVIGLLLSGGALLVQRAAGLRTPARSSRPADAAPAAGSLLQLIDAEGEIITARAVPLPGQGERTLALSRDGYLLLDAEGRVIHRL